MKALLKKGIILLALLGFHTMAFSGNAIPNIRIAKVEGFKKVSLELRNGVSTATTITLYDASGLALIAEKGKDQYYGKVFNLSKLPSGNYQFVITVNRRDIIQPLKLTETGLEIDPRKREVRFAPTVLLKDGLLDISYFNGTITNVKVAIFNADSDLVFEEHFNGVTKVERRYDISKLHKGNYEVQISTDYKNYHERIERY